MLCSECHADFESDAPAVGVGVVEVGEAADVVDFDEFEDVVDADAPFDVWCAFVHAHCVLLVSAISKEVPREVEEVGVRVVEGGGVVLVGQLSPKHIDTYTLTPFEFLEQGNAVEKPSIQIPCCEKRRVAVIEKFEVGDEIEGVVLNDVGSIGCWMDEEWEGHFVPLRSCLDIKVALAELSKPKTFVESQLGEVVVEFASQEFVETSGVAEREDRGIVVHLDATLFGVDIGDIGFVGGSNLELCSGDA